MPSSVNVPSSIRSASRSRAVSLSCSCWRAIRSSPPPSRACSRRSCRSSTSERSGGRATSVSARGVRSVRHEPLRARCVEHRLQHVHRRLGGHGARLLVVGRVEVRDLDPHQLAVLEHRVHQVVELVGMEAARCRHGRGEVLRVDHVEVEVHEHRRALERVLRRHERLDRARADHGRRAPLEQLALARVEVAHAREHHPLGRHGLAAQAGVPLAASRRPGTCRRGSRCPTSRACCSRRGRRATGSARRAGGGPPRAACSRPPSSRRPAAPACCRPSSASSTWPPASSRHPRDSRQVLLVARLAHLARACR